MPYCVAYGYSNSTDKDCPGVSFHRLPLKNQALLKQWLVALKLEEVPINDPNARVCSEHFSKSCFSTNLQEQLLQQPGRRWLEKDAVPTIFSFNQLPNLSQKRPLSERRSESKRRKEIVEEALLIQSYSEPTIEEDRQSKTVGVQTGMEMQTLVLQHTI